MSLKEKLDKISIPPFFDCGNTLDMYQRLKTYFVKLEQMVCPSSASQTMALINSMIVAVEDCHSGIEADMNPGYNTQGRMYPIQEDNIYLKENGQIIAQSKGNKILIESDGSFTILDRHSEEVILIKKHQ